MKKIFLSILSVAVFTSTIVSCSSDSLEPSLEQSRDFNLNPPSTLSDLQLLANGMYKRMVAVAYYGRDYIIFNEARTDNAYSTGASNRFLNVSQTAVAASAAFPTDTWTQIYRVIANSNLIISSSVTGAAANDLKAQALTARALGHFDLLKLFGQQHITGEGGMEALGVPYVKSYRDLTQLAPARNKVSEVKQMIYADIDAAIPLYGSTLDYTVINKQAALAIKSRVALYFKDWEIARDAAAAALAIGTASVVPESGFVSSFAADGKQVNSVFDLVQLSNDNNGINGLYQIYANTNYGDIIVNPNHNFRSIFESTDIRNSAAMIAVQDLGRTRNIGKYTKLATNTRVIRYEEIVLNYAEALFETGNTTLALTQLNRIASNRGATLYTVASKANILLERRRELAFEGFRFDDLVRNGQGIPTNPNLASARAYGDSNLAFPIPQSEINGNAVMKQNKGY
jgi:hypothetical protein